LRLLSNSGSESVSEVIRASLEASGAIDLLTAGLSIHAFGEFRSKLEALSGARLILPAGSADRQLNGAATSRHWRNRLQSRWLAARMGEWLSRLVSVRRAPGEIPQGSIVLRNATGEIQTVILGSVAWTLEGLGFAPGNALSLIQASETPVEGAMLGQWFESQWSRLDETKGADADLVDELRLLSERKSPRLVLACVLDHLFRSRGEALDEETVVRSATGIRDTMVWKKLFRFQRDGVVGALDKLERFGGCILADSVGLGKTFEALAIIKYHELRNDRALVLCPKRLRDNWSLYKSNDRRNVLAADRFNYDVLNHTDLSRDGGVSGDIDLAHVNWGNYDLVVIDESHNFRNKKTPRAGSETRYDRLMRRIIQEGVKTRVLMLSATPVNNRHRRR
jgi:SNF2 family DNA or RNA helicase